MKALVTGGLGFIGSHMANVLEREGYEVKIYDLPTHDITERIHIQRILKTFEPDEIYHIAGQAYLDKGEACPIDDLKVNVEGTLNILDYLKDSKAKMVFTSTGAVYGVAPLPNREDMNPRPVCNYGISKLAAEKYIQKYAMTEGCDVKIVRFSSIYGPGRKAGPVNIFLNQARERGALTIYGSGDQTRDFVHVDDVCQALRLVLKRGAKGEVYNVGSGVETSIMQVARIVNKLYPKATITHRPHDHSLYDLPRSWFDISKIRDLGFDNIIELEKGIEMTDRALSP